jgi:hypothetical protein
VERSFPALDLLNYTVATVVMCLKSIDEVLTGIEVCSEKVFVFHVH